jgi:hypothetical protein
MSDSIKHEILSMQVLLPGALCSVLLTKYHSGDQVKNSGGQVMWHVWGRGEVHTGL